MYYVDNPQDVQLALNYAALNAHFGLRCVALNTDISAEVFVFWKAEQEKELKLAAYLYGICGIRGWSIDLDPIIHGLSKLFLQELCWEDRSTRAKLRDLLFKTSPQTRSPTPAAFLNFHSWWDKLAASLTECTFETHHPIPPAIPYTFRQDPIGPLNVQYQMDNGRPFVVID